MQAWGGEPGASPAPALLLPALRPQGLPLSAFPVPERSTLSSFIGQERCSLGVPGHSLRLVHVSQVL